MIAFLCLNLLLAAPELEWHNDYATAVRQARREHKDVFIHFRSDDRLDGVLREPQLRALLGKYVLLEVSTAYEYKSQRLLDHECMANMLGKPGLVVASFHDEKLPIHEQIISVHPLVRSRYHWAPDYGVEEVKTILDLPAHATLSQRSMIYAVRVHPERPQSISGAAQPAFLAHTERHSARQASMCHQHHADLIGAMSRLSSQAGVGMSNSSEVVAESWGNFVGGENVLEAAFSCIDAWRHSPGHWGAVSRPHRYYGYDVARGANGTWYATGIFAD